MRALVWYGTKDVRVETINEPVVTNGKVKVKVKAAGICGSDLHAYAHGIGIQVGTPHPLSGKMAPLTMGHEFAGEVVEVSEGVTSVKVGDRVAIEPMYQCGACDNCKKGNYHLCEGFGFIGLNGDGGFADYVVVDPYMVHKLPDNVSFEEGALVEPTAVAVYAVKESKQKIGDTVAVFGVGPIGLLTVIAAKAAGAARIIAIDISPERLALAKEVGATHIINSLEENCVSIILSEYGGVDVAYEVAGVQATLTSAASVVKKGGEIRVISLFSAPAEIDLFSLIVREISITTSCAYHHVFPEVISMIENGVLDVQKVITAKTTLENIVEDGFEKLVSDKSQAKILIEI
ncbi:2,3-butanediol dehydrogenase [Caldibacillus lycopersici]|uniref:2,3-butanediol dehydrogenase n=1 Tax=Perspicuibacillus lycopersici TaxID=1325689 RepID=A0AAE3LRF4_9BACI|nr:2,3-butanediol dehydrogenase [Perspicuibacillus lycopersici]MCU9614589.1 2,3-butanediol dehydrogenase [Perspicuibacillus lycopersici]